MNLKTRILRISGITLMVYSVYGIIMHQASINSALPGFTIGIILLALALRKTNNS